MAEIGDCAFGVGERTTYPVSSIARVIGQSTPPTTVRTRCARLLLALVALAGLGFAHCAMSAAALCPADSSMSMSMARPAVAISDIAHHAAAEVFAVTDQANSRGAGPSFGSPDSLLGTRMPAGLLLTCVIALATLLFGAAMLWRRVAAIDRPPRRGGVIVARSRLPRAPSLSELCVLRT